jgi:hypothetical protein
MMNTKAVLHAFIVVLELLSSRVWAIAQEQQS